MEYTEGEWKIKRDNLDIYIEAHQYGDGITTENGVFTIALTNKAFAPSQTEEEAEANAHLIAHSPKLLKALEQLVWAVDGQGSGTIEHALTFAKSTIQTLDLS